MIKLSSNQIKLKFNSDVNENHWDYILQKIPEQTDKIMSAGIDPPQEEGWYANEVVTIDDAIGDIYDRFTDATDKVSLHYFEFALDESHLQFVSSLVKIPQNGWIGKQLFYLMLDL